MTSPISIWLLLPLNIAALPNLPLTPPVSFALPSNWYKATPLLSENISVVDIVVDANVSPYNVVI